MSVFKFKRFDVIQSEHLQKVGTDAMVLGAIAEYKQPKQILDIGTGTGVIALMLAQRHEKSNVIGLDIDNQAVELSRINFEKSEFSKRLQVVKSNFLEFKPPYLFDLIVTNPPYFNTQMPSSDNQRSLARHETVMTLNQLISHASVCLSEFGELWMILPAERTNEILNHEFPIFPIKQIKVFGKPNRHVRDILVFGKNKSKLIEQEITIRNENGKYSEEYIRLTKNFHFNNLSQ